MSNKFFYKPSLGYLLPCFSGLALITTAHAQLTPDQNWQRLMSNFQKVIGPTNTASITPAAQSPVLVTQPAQPIPAEKSSGFFKFYKVKDDDDWTRHFSIGAVVGLNIKANFKEEGVFNLPSATGSGTYDDGYVHPDQTGDTQSTGNWGYNNASQYNAAQQTLTFHGTTSYSTSGSSSSSGEPFPGFEMAYGGNLFYWQRVRVGWELGFDLLPMSFTDNSPMSASVSQNSYVFNTGGIVLPGAPYHGGASGVGEPLLPLSPSHTIPDPTPQSGRITGSRSLDAMLYSIRLGPTFYWNLSEHLSMSAGIGPAIGVVSAEYKFDETINTSNGSSKNTGSFSGTDVIFGGNINAALLYHMMDNGRPVDLYLSAEYMPMESALFSHGGREGKINLEGQIYLSAGINWAF